MKPKKGLPLFAVGLMLGAVLISLAGWFLYEMQKESIIHSVREQFLSINRMKAEQLESWRIDRLMEAQEIMDDPLLLDTFAEYTRKPAPSTRDAFMQRLDFLARYRNCENVIALDAEGAPILQSDDTIPLPAFERSDLDSARLHGIPVFSNLLRESVGAPVYLNLYAPINRRKVDGGHFLGTIVLRLNLTETLFPDICRWPVPSTTAEIHLVRRDGDSVLYLNNVRFRQGSAMTLRLPLTARNVNAVAGVNGHTGFLEGADYRNVGVVSVVSMIEATNWYIVTEMDIHEAYSRLEARSQLTIAFVLVCLLLLASGAGIFRQRGQRRHLTEMLAVQMEKLREERRHHATLMCVGDAVITTDAAGRVQMMNPVAEHLTGWRRSEAEGHPVTEVMIIVNEDTAETVLNPVHEVLNTGTIVGLANHTMLVSRDGSIRPIADTAAPIRTDDGSLIGVVLVLRDQTTERAHLRQLSESEERFRSLFTNMAEGVALHELVFDETGAAVNYRIVQCNPRYTSILGLRPDDVIGHLATEVYATPDPPFVEEYSSTALTGTPTTMRVHFPPMDKHFDISVAPWGRHGFATIFSDVTEAVVAEQQIRAARETLSDIVSSQPDGVYRVRLFHDADWVNAPEKAYLYEFISQRYLDLLGTTMEEALSDLSLIYRRIHPDDLQSFIDANMAASATTSHFQWEGRFVVHDQVRWMSVESLPRTLENQDTIFTGTIRDITATREAEAALKRFGRLMDTSFNEIYVFNAETLRFIQVSQGALRNLGYTMEEMSLLTPIDIKPELSAEQFHDLIAPLRDGATEMLVFQTIHERKNGQRYPVDVRLQLSQAENPPVFVAIIEDITERIRSRQELEEINRQLRRTIEYSPIPIILHAEDGEILQISKALLDITGYARDELTDMQAWLDLVAGAGTSGAVNAVNAAFTSERSRDHGDFTLRMADGMERIWDFHSAVIGTMADGRQTVVSMAIDVTDRRRAEAELMQLKNDLEIRVRERTAELEAANREMEAFTYSVSHDLRAPLRAIHSFSGIVVEDHARELSPTGQRHLQIIRGEAIRMGNLIDDLLKFSRLGRQALLPACIDMTPMIHEVYDELLHAENPRTVEFHVAELPKGFADVALLRQVWTNLISNALKYSRLRETAVITISGQRRDGCSEYVISDNGTGFNPAYSEKLFEVFQRLHTSQEYEGTGVGLALVHRIIMRHGGTIVATGEENAGATFTFTLPDTIADSPRH